MGHPPVCLTGAKSWPWRVSPGGFSRSFDLADEAHLAETEGATLVGAIGGGRLFDDFRLNAFDFAVATAAAVVVTMATTAVVSVATEQTAEQAVAAPATVASVIAMTTMTSVIAMTTMTTVAAPAAVAAEPAVTTTGRSRVVNAHQADADDGQEHGDTQNQSTIHPRFLQLEIR